MERNWHFFCIQIKIKTFDFICVDGALQFKLTDINKNNSQRMFYITYN